MARESIGKRIRKCRLKKYWSQEQLAEATGLSLSYVGMIAVYRYEAEQLSCLHEALAGIRLVGIERRREK